MKIKLSFFKKTRQLEEKFKTFLNNISVSGQLFTQATTIYLEKQACAKFIQLKEQIQQLETHNDALRREIEAELYRQMILPGMRSDLLDLMEACDHVINQYERVVILWSIECMKIPNDLFKTAKQLVKTTENCVCALTMGVQSFINGKTSVEDEVQECYLKEHIVDELAFSAKEQIFKKKLSLAQQLQLKEFVTTLEKISDLAEDAADKLKIISVKHAL